MTKLILRNDEIFRLEDISGSLGVLDYFMFIILMVLSCSGGFWYAIRESRGQTLLDMKGYLLGGKTQATFPVAMSLIASYVSGVTVLGTVTEVYNYGLQYYVIIAAVASSCLVVVYVFLPVFFNLQVSSSYEYLDLRFNRHVRGLVAALFLLDEILFLPVVVYVPALTIHQLIKIDIHIVVVVIVLVCGLYTVLGGLKAVIWTDLIQMMIMYVSLIIIAIGATVAVKGCKSVYKASSEHSRFSLTNWDPSPYERTSGWAVIFGGFFYWTCFNSVNQTMVQRYLSLPTQYKVQKAVFIFALGMILAISLCMWCGLVAWTAWIQGGCPSDGKPIAKDTVLPALVMWVQRVSYIPGFSGIFLAGVFGAGISSLSAVLNASALVIHEDIIKGWCRRELSPFNAAIVTRSATGALAFLSILMELVIEKLGTILGVSTALTAIAASSTCGIFTIGIFFWWVGPKGAVTGGVAGAIVAGIISFGQQAASAKGYLPRPANFSYSCMLNSSYVTEPKIDPDSIFSLFRFSFWYIAPFGYFTTLCTGATVGYILDRHDRPVMDAELFSPLISKCLPKTAIENKGSIRKLKEQKKIQEEVEKAANANKNMVISDSGQQATSSK